MRPTGGGDPWQRAASAVGRSRLPLLAVVAFLTLLLLFPHAPWRLPGQPALFPRKGQSVLHTVLVASWYAAALNALLCAALIATRRLSLIHI